MFKIGYRTIKTALRATPGNIIAQMLNLEYFSAAGIIADLMHPSYKKRSRCMPPGTGFSLFDRNGLCIPIISVHRIPSADNRFDSLDFHSNGSCRED